MMKKVHLSLNKALKLSTFLTVYGYIIIILLSATAEVWGEFHHKNPSDQTRPTEKIFKVDTPLKELVRAAM